MSGKVVTTDSVGNIVTKIERTPHPDSHFETRSVEIEPAANGGFTVNHRQRLKREHSNSELHYDSYREPTPHVFSTPEEMHAHVSSLFPAKKGK